MSTYDLIVVARELVYWEALKAFVGTALVRYDGLRRCQCDQWRCISALETFGRRLSRRAIRPAGVHRILKVSSADFEHGYHRCVAT